MFTLNQTQFAKHINVHKTYVTQLKQAGRLVMTDKGKVDVEASILRIKETEDPNRDDVKKRHATDRGADTLVDTIGEPKAEKAKKTKPAKEVDADAASFSKGRAKEQHFKALQAEIEYNERMGLLVKKEDMQAAVADVVSIFRQKIENLPNRVSPELVGKDLQFIRSRIKDECHEILTELSKDFKQRMEAREADLA